MRQTLIKAFLVALTFVGTHAQAQSTYVGRFDYFGGTTGGSRSTDLALSAPTYVTQFSIDVSGSCGVNAQILHNVTYPVGPTRLVSTNYSPVNPGMIRYTYSVNNGSGLYIVGIRGYMNGYPGYNCTGFAYVNSGVSVPQETAIQGTVVWVSNIATGNGDTSIRVQLDNGAQVYVQIVGALNALPQTRFNFRTVRYLSDLLYHRVQINGVLAGSNMRATWVQEL